MKYRPEIEDMADILSWSPLQQTSKENQQESSRFITYSIKLFQFPSNYQTSSLNQKGWKDKGGNQIIENKPWNKSSSFYKTRNELTTSKNILLKPNYIVIPQHSNIKCLKLLKIQGINFEKKDDGQDYQQILNPLLNLVMLVKLLGHLRSYVNH